jgi:acetolactate synthase-1/2/3 large subunit
MSISPLDRELDAPDAIVWALEEAGVELVVGIPGGYTLNIFQALAGHRSIRTVVVREESTGSGIAEACGRLTGRPVVLLGQGQWISGNAGQGLLEALLGAAPVVVLSEMTDGAVYSHHGTYQSGDADYGSWDAKRAFDGIAKRVMVSRYPSQAVQHTQLALKHATSGEPGPVVVLLGSQSLKGTIGPRTRPTIYSTKAYIEHPRHSVDEAVLAQAIALLESAARPMILAGNGVRVGQATANLLRLAEDAGIPVVTTASGKGVFDERHDLCGGPIGSYGLAGGNALLGAADVVLAVGTKLGPHDTVRHNPQLIDPQRQSIIQIDIEPLNASWTIPVEHVLIGDASHVMERIRTSLLGSDRTAARAAALERVRAARSEFDEFADARFTSDEFPFHPQRVIRMLEDAAPADTIVTCDAGENRIFMMHWFRNTFPGGYLQPAASGGMGYAVRAALGAKLAFPDQPVVAVCGDGGFGMTLDSLMTAVEERLPIVVLVLNNRSLGWVVHGRNGSDAPLHDFDFAGIALAIGCDGRRVTTSGELSAALAQAVAATERPYVIDVPIEFATSFRDVEGFQTASARRDG